MTDDNRHFVVESGAGRLAWVGGLGLHFKVWGDQTQGLFSIVEHPMEPRALAAPMHRHSREDECSYVIEGRVGAQLGDEVLEAGPGAYIFKPRDQWHTFWNAGDEPARILEIITPAGFEKYFEELADAWPDMMTIASIAQRYGFEVDPSTVPGLLERHGLVTGRPDA